jgi:hypothetical protein
MSSALDAFRAQREAVEQVHARLVEVGGLVQQLQNQIDAMGQDRAFRDVLRDESHWLERAERAIVEVRRLREQESARFWPGVWKRWAAAVVLSVVTLTAFGAGYAWASRPYDAELASLRQRVELLDFVAQRVLTMTPAERWQFDALTLM